MICFRDTTFCNAKCATTSCPRMLTDKVCQDARKWWKGEDAPVAVADFSPGCTQYEIDRS